MSCFYFQNQFHYKELTGNPLTLSERFGAGVFTTLLYNGEELCHLDLHLKRLWGSLNHFEIPFDAINPAPIIHTTLLRNGLSGHYARVNIFYCVDSFITKAQLLILTTKFTPQIEPLSLFTYPELHDSFLNAHKSMAYFPYLLAKHHAQKLGYDDAIMLGADRIITETSSAAVLFKRDGIFYAPKAKNSLPSITLKLAKEVFPIKEVSIYPEEVCTFTHAYTLNSLQGMQAVKRIDKHIFAIDQLSCQRANKLILKLPLTSHTCV